MVVAAGPRTGVDLDSFFAEARELPFLFKLRVTANVKRRIEKLAEAREWVDAGQGFEAKESEVRLAGWSRKRGA